MDNSIVSGRASSRSEGKASQELQSKNAVKDQPKEALFKSKPHSIKELSNEDSGSGSSQVGSKEM